MMSKLAFQLVESNAPNRYLIQLTDAKLIAALVISAGLQRGAGIEPIAVDYEEGGGELVLADGFEDTSARGRIAMKVLADSYCDILARILSRKDTHGQQTGQADHGAAVYVLH
jgi:hypothetical protein